jgi:3-oxoacyl-[acyl-carrier protein] reductase
MDLGLAGKKAIVTGGSRGIGLAIARALAAEGAAVGLLARNAHGLARAAETLAAEGARVEWAAADVTDTASHDEAVARLAEALGGLDVAVANVGGSAPTPCFTAPDDAWRQQWELNFLSAVRLGRAAAPYFARAGGGSLTVISSISALEAFGTPGYIAAKAALHGYAKAAAREGAAANVRVNCVAPGSILFPGGSWDRRRTTDPARFEAVVDSIPSGRLGTPEEVARVVAFVASPAASWITGTVIVVDGGQTKGF